MSVNTNDLQVENSSKRNYWKISTFALVIVLFILISSQFPIRSKRNKDQAPSIPTPTLFSNEQADRSIKFGYPGSFFSIFEGETYLDTSNMTTKRVFTITLRPNTVKSDSNEQTYSIPIEDADFVSTPSISYDKRFGCVTRHASGYSGYYIFSLPEGQKIAEGEQYSECISWVSDHEVLIAEQLYNTYDIRYFVLDIESEIETNISTFTVKKD